jgi:hypothetical protein
MPPIEKPVTIELDVNQIQDKVGTYINTSTGLVREVTLVDGKLRLLDLDLAPVSADEFTFEAFPTSRVRFDGASGDRPATLQIISDSSSNRYSLVDSEELSSAELSDYIGTYYSPELDLYWTVNFNDNQLAIERRKYGTTTLTMVALDVYKDDWSSFSDWPTEGMITFTRNNDNAVIGFQVSCERLRGLRFQRQDEPGG